MPTMWIFAGFAASFLVAALLWAIGRLRRRRLGEAERQAHAATQPRQDGSSALLATTSSPVTNQIRDLPNPIESLISARSLTSMMARPGFAELPSAGQDAIRRAAANWDALTPDARLESLHLLLPVPRAVAPEQWSFFEWLVSRQIELEVTVPIWAWLGSVAIFLAATVRCVMVAASRRQEQAARSKREAERQALQEKTPRRHGETVARGLHRALHRSASHWRRA